MAAEAVAIFIDAVDAQADVGAKRLVNIAGQAKAAVTVAGEDAVAGGLEMRTFGDAVDDAAAAAAAEDHGVRPLQDLQPVDVVEVAEILRVVADAVDEE